MPLASLAGFGIIIRSLHTISKCILLLPNQSNALRYLRRPTGSGDFVNDSGGRGLKLGLFDDVLIDGHSRYLPNFADLK